MSRSSLFSFSNQPGGYFISNGTTTFAKSVPPTLVTALDGGKLRDIKSISIAPNGGWIACYDDKAQGGPHGDNYFGEEVPKPLESYLEAHADEDNCNPLHWVKTGPQDQWFARRVNTMHWQLMPPVEAAMRKLQMMGLQRKLEELVFGPDNTAIFIFSNGSFMWDLPLDSEQHSILQQHYAMGTHLEAAALSFADPRHYFFLWGNACASFKMPDSEHASVTEMVNTCAATRMQLVLDQENQMGTEASQHAKQHKPLHNSSNCNMHNDGNSSCREANLVSDNISVDALILQHTEKNPTTRHRHGSGNLWLWPTAKLIKAAAISTLTDTH
ncbi:hypothetical protein ABBQ32_005605 [Trebouxia sp. C0010 RCD-2024]